ncbi:hypothetical protein BKA70DRAFT_1193385 [Coprinopsis sp. MPI-PUGE-AT-0042]|nr:hypothetical protein BKA70DRAFT_1193385 [Coprinopsis sp. MPI-PUGE-AT-0042]
MHHCLRVQDIILSIFTAVRDLESKRPKTMAALARTCRSFYEPAIKVLWREIPGIYPVASLFPEDDLVIEKKGTIVSSRIKQKALSNCAYTLSRLKFYGSFVRTISYHRRKRLHPQTLAFVNEVTEFPNPLFPRATCVVLPCTADRFLESILYPAVVLSPAVRSVALFTEEVNERKGDKNSERWAAILDRLECLLPVLNSFKVDQRFIRSFDEGELPTVPEIDTLTKRLSANLITLVITGVSLSPQAISSISQLESLEVLTLTIDYRNYKYHPSTILAFPALVKLHVLGDARVGEDLCIQFIQSLHGPRLLSLQIDLHLSICSVKIRLHNLLLALSLPHVAPRLSRIKIDSEDYPLPALGFRDGYLPHNPPVPLTPPIWVEYRMHFPHVAVGSSRRGGLASFDSNHESVHDSTKCEPKLTIAGVAAALHHCPLLTDLTLRCDAREIPPADASPPHRSLRSWDVCASPIKSGAAFAAWARKACPNLTVIKSFSQVRQSISDPDYFKEPMKMTKEDISDVIMLSQWNDASRILAKRR